MCSISPATPPVISSGLIICLSLMTFDLCHAVSLDMHGDTASELSRDLSSYLDVKVSAFKDALQETFTGGKHRQKRALTPDLPPASNLSWQLQALPTIDYNGTTVMEHFYVGGNSYLVVGKSRGDDGGYDSTAEIFIFDSGLSRFDKATGVDAIPTSGLSDIAAHLVGDYIYLAIGNQQFSGGEYNGMSNIYRFDPQTSSVNFFMQLYTKGVSDMEFFDYKGDVYLAVANMRSDLYAARRAEVQIYTFLNTNFDLVTSVETYGASSIATFESDSVLYLAVAQYLDNDGNYDLGTNVYQFDTETSTLKLVQTLSSSAPLHVEAMVVDGRQFLAIANNLVNGIAINYDTTSAIYWWEGAQFWQYQKIDTHGAAHIEYIQVTDDYHLLAIVNIEDVERNVVLYQYDEDSGDWLEATQQFEFGDPANAVAMTTIVIENEMFLGLANNITYTSGVNNTNFYKFLLVNETKGPAELEIRPHKSCINTMQADIEVQTEDLANLTSVVQQSLSRTQDQNITGPIIILGNATFDQTLRIQQNLTVEAELAYIIDPSLEADIDDGNLDTEALKSDIEQNAVTIIGDQDIQGHVTFTQDVHVSSHTEANITSNDGSINDILHLATLNGTILRTTGDQVVDGGETIFSEAVTMQDDVNVEGLVNDINIPDNIMTLIDVQSSSGELTFAASVSFDSNVEVEGQVNQLDTDDVISTVRNHTIGGTKTIGGDVDAPNVIMGNTKTIDGVDVSDFAPTVIRLSTGGTLNDAIIFNGSATFTNITIGNDLINDVDTSALIDDIVFIDTDQEISGAKNFTQNMHIHGNLTISGSINDIDVSEELITLAANQTIETNVTVDNTMTVRGDVIVIDTVNRVNLDRDSVLDHSDQVISGKIDFANDVTAQSNINMEDSATVSGVDISNLDDTSIKITGPQRMNGIKTFENSVSVNGNVTFVGLANDLNVTYLYEDVLSYTQPQTFDLPTTFGGNITLNGEVSLDSIDGYQISNFTLLDSDGTIEGHKTFLDSITMQGNLNVTGNVNDKSFTDLDAQVLKNVNAQEIQGHLTFTSDLYVNSNIDVDNVNSYNLTDDFVALDGWQNIDGTKTFTDNSVTVQGEIMVKWLTVADGLINDVDVAQIVDNAVLDGVDGNMQGSKTFDQIDVVGDVDVEGTINNVDLADFNQTAVKLDESQTVQGDITFSSDIRFGADANVGGTMNDIDIGVRSPDVVLRDEDGNILGDKQFDSDVTMQADLHVDGLVNDVDFPHIQDVYLSKTTPQSITVGKTFTNDIHLENLDLVSSDLDGVDTADLALLDADETFTVAIEFDNDVEARGDASVTGDVDGVDVVELNNTAVYITGLSQTVDGVKTFSSVVVDGNITMVDAALVNNVDVSDIDDVSVKISGNQSITLATIFEELVHIHGNLESHDDLGPYNLRNLIADAVFFNTTESISGQKTFTSEIQVTHLDIAPDLDVNVVQGDMSLWYLMNNTITKTMNQTIDGSVIFQQDMVLQDNLQVEGLLNGVEFPENAVLTYSDQTITTQQTFDSGFEIAGNLSIDGNVDSIDVDDLESVRVSLSREQVLEGEWEILQDVDVTGNISVQGIVNDMVVRDQLVTLTDVQSIGGTKTFLGNITVQGNVECAEVNTENLVEFQSDMVLRVGNFTITGEKTFSAELTLSCKNVRGLVDGVNVTELPQNSADSNVFQDDYIDALNQSVQAQCPYVTALQETYEGQPLVLDQWMDWISLNATAGSYIDTIPYENASLLVVAETSDTPFHKCIQTSLYRCSPYDVDEPCWNTDTTLGSASSARLFAFYQLTFIVLTGSGEVESCEGQEGYTTTTRVTTVEDRNFNETIESQAAVDSIMFELNGEVYLFIANYKHTESGSQVVNSTLHKYDNVTQTFDHFQDFLTYGAKGVTFLEHEGNAWLAWANSEGTVDSVISKWNETEQKFLPSMSIQTKYASDIISFVIDGVPHIATSNEKSVSRFGVSACDEPVVIYSYDESLTTWNLIQSIVAPCIIDLEVFAVDDIVYLVLISSDTSLTENILIYKWSGLSLFELYQELSVEDAIQAHSFAHLGSLYMSITRPVMCPFADEHAGGPQILAGVIRGMKSSTEFTFWE